MFIQHASEWYMDVPPKERKLFKSSNFQGLHESVSDKEVIEKSQAGFFQHSINKDAENDG